MDSAETRHHSYSAPHFPTSPLRAEMDSNRRRRFVSLDNIPYADADVASVGSVGDISNNGLLKNTTLSTFGDPFSSTRLSSIEGSLNNFLDALSDDDIHTDGSFHGYSPSPGYRLNSSPIPPTASEEGSAITNCDVRWTPVSYIRHDHYKMGNGTSNCRDHDQPSVQMGLHVPPVSYTSQPSSNSRETNNIGQTQRRNDAKQVTKEQKIVCGVNQSLRERYETVVSSLVVPPPLPLSPKHNLKLQHYNPNLQLIGHQPARCIDSPTLIPLEQLFGVCQTAESMQHDIPRCLLVEGDAGYGKTTLCLKLLSDWVGRKSLYLSPFYIVFFVQLRDLCVPLMQYVYKEIIPKGAISRDEMNIFWKWVNANENKVLFILDGFEERGPLAIDAIALLQGQLLPQSQVLVTCNTDHTEQVLEYVQRHVRIVGYDWSQIQLCVRNFFSDEKDEIKLLDILSINADRFLQFVSCPLMCLLICYIFEHEHGSLPSNNSELFNVILKYLVRQSAIGTKDANVLGDIPTHCKQTLLDFGKLCLTALKSKRLCYSESEIKNFCHNTDVLEFGFLRKGWSLMKSKKRDHYRPLHSSFCHFLCAYYISSVTPYVNILKRELDCLPGSPDFSTNLTVTHQILRYLMGILSRRAYLVLGLFSMLDISIRTLFTLLHDAGAHEANLMSVCKVLSSSPSVQVHCHNIEMDGWACVIPHPKCYVESLELLLQPDHLGAVSMNSLFNALLHNESITKLRVSSLLGHELCASDIEQLAVYIKRTLGKPRLTEFELVITCLEDTRCESFQPLIDAVCHSLLSTNPNIKKLVLDIRMDAAQVREVCDVLHKCPQVLVLHLPHLGCGKEGLSAISELLHYHPLAALNLTGGWHTGDDDDVDTQSDRFSPFQLFIRQPTTSSNHSTPKTSFFSLPRGGVHMYNSLNRGSPVLRHDEKRNSDSILFQKAFLPLPLCDSECHRTGLHAIFESIRDKDCRLRSLNVGKCLMTGEDFMCLGETVRKSQCLDALRMEGSPGFVSVLPVIVALPESTCLQLLDVTSNHMVVADKPFQMLCQSLSRSTTLRLACFEGWTFKLEDESSMDALGNFLQKTSICDLVLTNCRINISTANSSMVLIGKSEDAVSELVKSFLCYKCPSVSFLRLGGVEVHVDDKIVLKGCELVPFLKGFIRLEHLDLSVKPEKSINEVNHSVFDEKAFLHFFQSIKQNFPVLRNLDICNWQLCIEDTEKIFKKIGKCLQNCSFTSLSLNSLTIKDTDKQSLEHTFIQTVITNLPRLTLCALIDIPLDCKQGNAIGKRIRDYFTGCNLEIHVKGVPVESVKEIIAAVTEGDKAQATFTGGTNCAIKIKKNTKNSNFIGRLLASIKT